MTSTNSSGAGSAVCPSGTGRFPRGAAVPLSAGEGLVPAFGSREEPRCRGEDLSPSGTLSPEEFRELALFEDFLEQHVQRNGICDVQCMLLWSEWVRAFRRKSSGFPTLIREKEFRSAVTGTFHVGIARDASRGPVFPGIKFVS